MTMRTTTLITAVAFALTSCSYEPPVRGKDDRWRNEAQNNTLKGSVRVYGPQVESLREAGARAMVLVFDAESPGPPEGTSGPVDFAIIPEDAWTGSAELGWTAEWVATDVADGEYLVDVIIDFDGDFGPTLFTLGGATCGDWQGSHYGVYQPEVTVTTTGTDTGVPDTGPVFGKGRIPVGLDDDHGVVVSGISVEAEIELVTERPAFRMSAEAGYARVSLTEVGTAPLPPVFKLNSTGIHVQYTDNEEHRLELADPCQTSGARECVADTPENTCDGSILLYYPDKDGDGRIDPHPDYPVDFGLKDVWPRVLLEYLGTPEFNEDGTPKVDESGYPVFASQPTGDEGYFWGTEGFTFGIEGAGFNLAVAPIGVPTKVNQIDVMFPPLVAKFYDEWNEECGGEPPADPTEGCSVLYDLADAAQREQVPKGVWGPNLISITGQTWGIPNEISELGLAPTTEAMDITKQGGFVWVVQ